MVRERLQQLTDGYVGRGALADRPQADRRRRSSAGAGRASSSCSSWCRAASCPRRTRATSSSPTCCPMPPAWSGPRRSATGRCRCCRKTRPCADVAQLDGYSLIDSQNQDQCRPHVRLAEALRGAQGKEATAFAVRRRCPQRKFAGIKEGMVMPLNPPSIPGLGTTGGFEFYIQSKGSGTSAGTGEEGQGTSSPRPASGRNWPASPPPFRASQQQLYLDLDRAKAEILGVPVSDRLRDPAGLFRLLLCRQFTQFGRIWQVIIQAQPRIPGRAGRLRPDLSSAPATARWCRCRP